MNTNTYIIDEPIIHYQDSPNVLIQQTLDLGLGNLSDSGALCVRTGKFTGRSPENKYFVKDDIECVMEQVAPDGSIIDSEILG